MVPVYYALNDTRYPVIGSFLAVAANFSFIILTLGALQHRSIALATSLSMILNFIFLSVVLYFKVEGYPLQHLGRCVAKICLAAGIMGILIHFLAIGLNTQLNAGLASRLLALLGVMTAGLLVYGVSIYILQVPEFQELILQAQRFRKKI